jgi:hypothetical protein
LNPQIIVDINSSILVKKVLNDTYILPTVYQDVVCLMLFLFWSRICLPYLRHGW